MHPALAEVIVRQHIEDLHRDAAKQRRLGMGSQKRRAARRKATATRLQRAPAH